MEQAKKVKIVEFKQLLRKVHEELDDLISGRHQPSGVMSGIKGLDGIIGGFRAPDLTILAARTGVGKTALMINWVCKSLWAGHDVIFFSLEMSASQIIQRMLVHMAKIPGRVLRQGGDRLTKHERSHHAGELLALISSIVNAPKFGRLFICDDGGINIADIADACRFQAVHIVYVDYIQLVRPTSEADRHIQVGEVSMGLKKIAMDLNVPVVAAAQLKRLAAKMTPSLNDLRESGSLEQDADQVIIIDRELTDGVPASEGEGRIMVMKNRHGATGATPIWYDGSTFTFRDYDVPE